MPIIALLPRAGYAEGDVLVLLKQLYTVHQVQYVAVGSPGIEDPVTFRRKVIRALDGKAWDGPGEWGFKESQDTEQETTDPRRPVYFSSFYPASVEEERYYSLYVYAHSGNALARVETDIARFTEELGGVVPTPHTTPDFSRLRPGTPVTVYPKCDGIEFSPPRLTKQWDRDPTRFGFELRAKRGAAGKALEGEISILVKSVEIAHMGLTIQVVAPMPDSAQEGQPSVAGVPRAALNSAQAGTDYRKFFVSYAPQDSAVVDLYQNVLTMVGDDLFRDTTSIKPGQDRYWAVCRGIDSANVFQLFWSSHAAASRQVREEWTYALETRGRDTRGTGFIRPVYWDVKRPDPPPELSHLQFHHVSLPDLRLGHVSLDDASAQYRGAVRKLLLEAYDAEALSRFCQDHPLLQPVTYRFSASQGLDVRADHLLDYCQEQSLFPELLALVKNDNPRQYARFESEMPTQQEHPEQ